MIRGMWLESRFFAMLAAAGVAASVAAFLILTRTGVGPNEQPPVSARGNQTLVEGPGVSPFESTGEYRVTSNGVGLTVVSFSISPAQMAVLFSLDTSFADQVALPSKAYLVDDKGKEYGGSMSVLGSQLGVTAVVLVTEPYDGVGASLALAVNGVTVSAASGASDEIGGDWTVRFVDNRRPGAADYTLSAKMAPEVTKFGDVTITKAGGSPGLGYIALLIDRGGQQSAVYGAGSKGFSEADFRGMLLAKTGAEELPVSPDFPQPAKP